MKFLFFWRFEDYTIDYKPYMPLRIHGKYVVIKLDQEYMGRREFSLYLCTTFFATVKMGKNEEQCFLFRFGMLCYQDEHYCVP